MPARDGQGHRLFHTATDSEILCHKITGQYFETISNHTDFIKNGGCDRLICVLAFNYLVLKFVETDSNDFVI